MFLFRSGSEEAYSEKDQLLTELATMQSEKDVPPPPSPGQQSARADRQLALQLREDALAILGEKQVEKEPETKRHCGSTADSIVQYLEKKEERAAKAERERLALAKEGEAEERKLAIGKLEVEKMRLRLQEREFEERLETQREEAAMRQKKEEDDRKKRRDFMQMMAGIVSNLQKK